MKDKRPLICVHRRLGGIGDVIMTTPLLKAIKTLIPQCHLIYATDFKYSNGALKQVIEHNPYVDQIISNEEIKQDSYAYYVNVTETGLDREKPGTVPPNRIDMFAAEAGVSVEADPVPTYIVTNKERKDAIKRIEESFLEPSEKREDIKLIAVQARSNDARRTWPFDHVDKLCDLLAEDPKVRVMLFDWGNSASRWEARERVYPMRDESLIQTAGLVEQTDLVICPDSSMLHLAGALGKKIVTVFGSIPPMSRINHYYNTHVVYVDMPCHPCWYSPRCTRVKNSLECLLKVTPEMVHKAAMKKLSDEYISGSDVKYGKDMTKVGGQDPVILVKRTTSGMGDLTMATTGIEALKKKFPTKGIHVAIDPSLHDVLKNNPYVDAVLDINQPVNPKRYYMIIDISYPCARYETARLHAGKEVEKNRVEIFAEALGTRNFIEDLKPKFHVSREEKEFGKNYLKASGADPKKRTFAIAMHSAELYRDWPQENYKELIRLIKHKYNIVILHSEREDFYEGTIDACGLSLREAVGILSCCDGLVTVDTGFLHIAAALNIPTIALFGPIDYRARCKGYKNTTVIVSELSCVPCWRNANTKCQRTGIIKGHSDCMKNITPNKVAKIINIKL